MGDMFKKGITDARGGARLWTDDNELRFIADQLPVVCLHSRFKPGRWWGGVEGAGDTFSRDVESDIVSVTVETETVTTDGVTKGENLCDEEEGMCTKGGSLGDGLVEEVQVLILYPVKSR